MTTATTGYYENDKDYWVSLKGEPDFERSVPPYSSIPIPTGIQFEPEPMTQSSFLIGVR
ncbi:MAG: hypothetical protein AAGG51_00270 [Cyanobacteria bacterium P01_G01_bin.54]